MFHPSRRVFQLGALSLPWLLAAPAPLALLFLKCSSLVPSFAEQCLWDGQCGFGRNGSWEFLPCSPSHPSTALPAVLPLIFDPSLPSPPESARSRGRKRGLLPDGSKCSICNTLSEEITAESLSLIKQPGQILHEPAGQPHPLTTGGEATGAGDVGRVVAEGGLNGERIGLDPPAVGWVFCHLPGPVLYGSSSCSVLPMGCWR